MSSYEHDEKIMVSKIYDLQLVIWFEIQKIYS